MIIQITNHYPEDSSEIARRVTSICGDNYDPDNSIVSGKTIEIHLTVDTTNAEALRLFQRSESLVRESFSPANIQVEILPRPYLSI